MNYIMIINCIEFKSKGCFLAIKHNTPAIDLYIEVFLV